MIKLSMSGKVKSFTSKNIEIAFAKDENKILLIDSDIENKDYIKSSN